MKRFPTVDEYIDSADRWKPELIQLRTILASTDLVETVKWGGPCYTLDGKLVVGLGAFNSYVGLWFFQGALLADTRKVLVNAREGKTRALRQWRFLCKADIKAPWIREYIDEAIRLQRKGMAIRPDRAKPVEIPPELKRALSQNKKVKASFVGLAKGKQREYTEYIAGAKREETKAVRLKKILPMIAKGKGLNDQYR